MAAMPMMPMEPAKAVKLLAIDMPDKTFANFLEPLEAAMEHEKYVTSLINDIYAAALVYGIAQLLEYLMSTLYHALAAERAKRVFKVLDHSGIYLLIAGTYTPYCLITLGHVGGIWLAAFVWAVSLVGIAFEAFWTYRPRWISAVLYVALGWSIVFFIPTLFAELAPAGFWLLVAGGISYTVGAVFYIFKKVRYMHSIFHLFVLAASCLQFFSVYFFVI